MIPKWQSLRILLQAHPWRGGGIDMKNPGGTEHAFARTRRSLRRRAPQGRRGKRPRDDQVPDP
jgi:hypothetical protein